jgi:uncharacterized membrane protein YoaK (UPF0700 family)
MARQEKSGLLASQRMRVAYLLAVVGGYLDAYTYFERGGVFANAQTGNIVKLGIAIANGASDTYLRFLLPIITFTLGLITSLTIDYVLERRGIRLIRRTVLALEALGLVIVGFIPLGDAWNTPANCIVSFLAAMQYETFTTFRGDAIVTTMSTGNLRKMVDALFKGVVMQNRGELARAARYLSIIVTFATGAILGTWFCDLLVRAAVIPVVCLLLATIGVITVLRRRQGAR